MTQEEWSAVSADLASWETEASLKDMRISEESNILDSEEISLPPVRQPKVVDKGSNEVAAGKAKPVSKTDYAAWDKYDPDTELLKMELQEERERERKEQALKQKQEVKSVQNRLKSVIKEAEKLSEMERQVLAEREKDTGNEYYKANDIKMAIDHYSASIAIWPSAKAYNNRANCHLIQCEYSAALADANKTLEMEPDNVKALFRRAQALRNQNRFSEALEDINKALTKEPSNLLCKKVANKLRELIQNQNNKNSLKTQRLDSNGGLGKLKNPVDTMKHSSKTAPITRGARIVELSDSEELWKEKNLKYPHHMSPRPPSQGPRIIELSDDSTPRHNRSKMNIIEVEKFNVNSNINKQKRTVVVDKRTHRNMNNINNMFMNGDPRPGCSFWT